MSSVKRTKVKNSVLDKLVITKGNRFYTYHIPSDLKDISQYIKHAEDL